jgi:hypothetical protein
MSAIAMFRHLRLIRFSRPLLEFCIRRDAESLECPCAFAIPSARSHFSVGDSSTPSLRASAG